MAKRFQAFDKSGNNNVNNVNKMWQYIDKCQPNYQELGPVRDFKRKKNCSNI